MPLLSFLVSSLPFFLFPCFPYFCRTPLYILPFPALSLSQSPPCSFTHSQFLFSPLSSQSLSSEYTCCILFSLPADSSSCEVSEEKQIHITDTNYIFIFESMKCLHVLLMLYTQISWVLGGIFLTSIIIKISFIFPFWGFPSLLSTLLPRNSKDSGFLISI